MPGMRHCWCNVFSVTKASRKARQSCFGERSDYRGCGGETLPRWPEISKLGGVEGVVFEFFKGACTTRQCGDGRV